VYVVVVVEEGGGVCVGERGSCEIREMGFRNSDVIEKMFIN